MNFSKLQLSKTYFRLAEATTEAEQQSSENARVSGEENQKTNDPARKNSQRIQSARKTLPSQSDVVYNSFDVSELIRNKEVIHMVESNRVNWRQELYETGEHPYVDVLPGDETKKDTEKLVGKKKKNIEKLGLDTLT